MTPLIIALGLLGAVALAAPAPAVALEPLDTGWERHFALSWAPAQRAGQPVVSGKIDNVSPYTFDRLRVLVEALDESGRVTARRVAWVPGILGGSGHHWFEIPMEPAARYRVRVFSYERLESPSDGFRF
jgi:hypothetical protein